MGCYIVETRQSEVLVGMHDKDNKPYIYEKHSLILYTDDLSYAIDEATDICANNIEFFGDISDMSCIAYQPFHIIENESIIGCGGVIFRDNKAKITHRKTVFVKRAMTEADLLDLEVNYD